MWVFHGLDHALPSAVNHVGFLSIHSCLWMMDHLNLCWGDTPAILSEAVFILSLKYPILHPYLGIVQNLPNVPPVCLTMCLYNWLIPPQGFAMWYPNTHQKLQFIKKSSWVACPCLDKSPRGCPGLGQCLQQSNLSWISKCHIQFQSKSLNLYALR